MTTTCKTIANRTIAIATLTLALAGGIVVSSASSAGAVNITQSGPIVSCMAGYLDLGGRAVTAHYDGEVIYSRFFVYRWTNAGWTLEEATDWQKLNAGRTQMSWNRYGKIKQVGTYYTTIERIATWDGRTWIYDDALSKLKSGYEGFGGSGYYAKCN